MPAGRPTSYNPGFCQEVMDLGKQGKSITQMAAALDVCKDSLYEWEKTIPEFSDALKRARQLSQAWWEDRGQEGLDKPGFQSSLWAKQVSCRFRSDYSEKSTVEVQALDDKGQPANPSFVFVPVGSNAKTNQD